MQIFYSILIVVIGIYASVLLNFWLNVEGEFVKSFLGTNIADAVNPIVTLLLTFVVTYFINVKFTNSNKIYELFLELFNDYKKLLDDVEKSFNEYIELKEQTYNENCDYNDESIKKLQKYEKELKKSFKNLSIKLDTIFKINNEIEQKISINTDSFKTNLRNLKSKITNDPFGQSSIFNESSIIEIHNIFEFIKKDIFLQKVRFYK